MPSIQMHTLVQPLFGGAIKGAIPDGFHDVSQFRDVPDHQEVFVAEVAESNIMFDLLEPDEDATDIQSAARYHFEQLSRDNEADPNHTRIVLERTIPETMLSSTIQGAKATVIAGTQQIAKYNERGADAYNTVAVYMGLIQLGRASTDVVITYNQTVEMGATSSSRAQFEGIPDCILSIDAFVDMLCQFEVVDWSLFG
ncbi:hypothetical protein RTP6_002796 [Batrachochytrium dendrobatidis]